jgi:hypothetical protein
VTLLLPCISLQRAEDGAVQTPCQSCNASQPVRGGDDAVLDAAKRLLLP